LPAAAATGGFPGEVGEAPVGEAPADERVLGEGTAEPSAANALGDADGWRGVGTPLAESDRAPLEGDSGPREVAPGRETMPYAAAPVKSATTVAAAVQPSTRGQRRVTLCDCEPIALRRIADVRPSQASKPMATLTGGGP
jgi:hypothetical protein